MKPHYHFLWVLPVLGFALVVFLSSKGINVFHDYPAIGVAGCIGVFAMLGTFVWLAGKGIAASIRAAIDQHENQHHS